MWLGEPVPKVAGAGDVSIATPIATPSAATDVQSLASKVGAGAGVSVAADFLCAPRDATKPTRGAFER